MFVLSDQQITSFQRLYRERFGRELSREDAIEQGTKLVVLMRRIYRPMKNDEPKEVRYSANDAPNL